MTGGRSRSGAARRVASERYMIAERKAGERRMSRAGGLLGVVAMVALATIVAGAATAAKKPQPPETSRRCRAVLGRDVLNLTSVGLRNMASCQRHADAGRPPRSDCNGLETMATTAYGRAEELLRRQRRRRGHLSARRSRTRQLPGRYVAGLDHGAASRCRAGPREQWRRQSRWHPPGPRPRAWRAPDRQVPARHRRGPRNHRPPCVEEVVALPASHRPAFHRLRSVRP